MNVLIIEDDATVASWLAKFLREIASNVIIAHNLQDGINHIVNHNTPFDVISLDLGLPDSLPEQTIQSIESIKEKNPDCLLVVVTGHRHDEYRKTSIAMGADAYLDKSDAITDECHGFFASLYDATVSLMSGKRRYSGNVEKLEFIAKALCARQGKLSPRP